MGIEGPQQPPPQETAGGDDPRIPEGIRRMRRPEDEGRVVALEKRLTEYRDRLEEDKREGLRPEEDEDDQQDRLRDTEYKIFVLERLLERGEVNAPELSTELLGERGGIDYRAFDNAYGAIKRYAEAGGKGVQGSTGS
jgi:hypothetical protein